MGAILYEFESRLPHVLKSQMSDSQTFGIFLLDLPDRNTVISSNLYTAINGGSEKGCGTDKYFIYVGIFVNLLVLCISMDF